MRWRLATLAAAVVAIGAVVAVIVLTRSETGLDHARETCARVEAFTTLVRENADAETALRALERARESARAAVEAENRWLPLWSGVEALHTGFRKDDPDAVRAGVHQVESTCESEPLV